MTIVVGAQPFGDARAALELGANLARTLPERSGVFVLVVATVVPPREDGRAVDDRLARAQDAARAWAAERASGMQVEFVTVPARSVARALVQVAVESDATALVLGSSSDGGLGHVVVGSTADHLLHSSRVPVAVAPRGYRAAAVPGAGPLDVPVRRLTAAFGPSAAGEESVRWAAALTRSIDVGLRVASFGVRTPTMFPPEVGFDVEAEVSAQWQDQMLDAQRALALGPEVETVAPVGTSWADAMDRLDWQPNELLIVGSSSAGVLRAVFLGARATKLVRHSPVPVLVVPRGTTPPS